jgi:hypothetical protein
VIGGIVQNSPADGRVYIWIGALVAVVWVASLAVVVFQARRKHRSVAAWACAGVFLGPIAALRALLVPDAERERARRRQQAEHETRVIRAERQWREALAQTPRPPADVRLPEPLEDAAVPETWRDAYGALRAEYMQQRPWVLKGSPPVARQACAAVVRAVADFLAKEPPEHLRAHAEEVGREIQRLAALRTPPDQWARPPGPG